MCEILICAIYFASDIVTVVSSQLCALSITSHRLREMIAFKFC